MPTPQHIPNPFDESDTGGRKPFQYSHLPSFVQELMGNPPVAVGDDRDRLEILGRIEQLESKIDTLMSKIDFIFGDSFLHDGQFKRLK